MSLSPRNHPTVVNRESTMDEKMRRTNESLGHGERLTVFRDSVDGGKSIEDMKEELAERTDYNSIKITVDLLWADPNKDKPSPAKALGPGGQSIISRLDKAQQFQEMHQSTVIMETEEDKPQEIDIKITHSDHVKDVKRKIEKCFKRAHIIQTGGAGQSLLQSSIFSHEEESTEKSVDKIDEGDEYTFSMETKEIRVIELRVKRTMVLPDTCKITSVITPHADQLVAVVEYTKQRTMCVNEDLHEIKPFKMTEHRVTDENYQVQPSQKGMSPVGSSLQNKQQMNQLDHYMMNGSNPNISPSNQFYFSRSSFYNSRQQFMLGDISHRPFIFKETAEKQQRLHEKKKSLTLLNGLSTPSLRMQHPGIRPHQTDKILISEQESIYSPQQQQNSGSKPRLAGDITPPRTQQGASKQAFNSFKPSNEKRVRNAEFKNMYATATNSSRHPLESASSSMTETDPWHEDQIYEVMDDQQSRTHHGQFFSPQAPKRGSLPPLQNESFNAQVSPINRTIDLQSYDSKQTINMMSPRNSNTTANLGGKQQLPALRGNSLNSKVHRGNMQSHRDIKQIYMKRALGARKYMLGNEMNPPTPQQRTGNVFQSQVQNPKIMPMKSLQGARNSQPPANMESGISLSVKDQQIPPRGSQASLVVNSSESHYSAQSKKQLAKNSTPEFAGSQDNLPSMPSETSLQANITMGTVQLKKINVKRQMQNGVSQSSFMHTDNSPSRSMNISPMGVEHLSMQFAQLAKQGGITDNEHVFCQAVHQLEQMGIFGIMKMVHDREILMNAMYLFTLGNLKLPHNMLIIRSSLCQRIIKTLTPQMVQDIFKREKLSFDLIDSVYKMPLSLRKDSINLITRMLNLCGLCTEKKSVPTLDWLIEAVKLPNAALKTECLRVLVDKTSEHFKIDEERLAWACQIKPHHLGVLKETSNSDNSARCQELAITVQENLRFIIKNYKAQMTFLHAGLAQAEKDKEALKYMANTKV